MKTIKTGVETPTSMSTFKMVAQRHCVFLPFFPFGDGADFKISKVPQSIQKYLRVRGTESTEVFFLLRLQKLIYKNKIQLATCTQIDFSKSPNTESLGFSTLKNKTPESSPKNVSLSPTFVAFQGRTLVFTISQEMLYSNSFQMFGQLHKNLFLLFRFLLTRNGSQVEIISDHLLQFVVNRSFLKLKTQVMSQIFVNYFAQKRKQKKTKRVNCQLSS